MILWHGTKVPNITKFYRLSHFGTFNSAYTRSGVFSDKKYMYRCEINTTGYVEILDFGNEVYDFGNDLYHQKIINKEECKLVSVNLYHSNKEQWTDNLCSILKQKGIRGFYYTNVAESSGDISYIVIDPIDVVKMDVYSRSRACELF